MAHPRIVVESIVNSSSELGRVRNTKTSIHVFVISWLGKHDNAERIVKAVTPTSNFVSVIYSDPDNNRSPQFSCPSVRRPNELFFGDKFKTCIDSCDADILLIIHADCDCNNWSEVPEHCIGAIDKYPNIGVWAPFINFTDWSLNITEIDKIKNSTLSIVAQTDGIVVGLTRRIVERMRRANLEGNLYGWGTDLMFNYYTYSIGMISVIDSNLLVRHPRGSQYQGEVAALQELEFLKQLTVAEKVQSDLLDAIVDLRYRMKQAGPEDFDADH